MIYQEFIDADIKIFGLNGVDEHGKCKCGNPECKALYKHPIASNWQYTPHWSDEQLEVMEISHQLDTGYGVLVENLLIIDVDARNGGVDSFNKLMDGVPAVMGAGLVVNTGSGGGSKHLYFSLDAPVALLQHHDDYPGIDFKSNGFVVGPGSMHASGNTYDIAIGSPFDIEQAPQGLIDLLKKPDKHRAQVNGQSIDVSHADIKEMLAAVDPDCGHETWYRCGMAVHHGTGGTGFDIWDDWSNRGDKYPGRSTLEKRWHSFGKAANPVTMATLIHYAEAGGWSQPVEFVTSEEFDYEEEKAPDDLPFSIEGVDLLRPPGFVGEVCQWINDQCRYPREHLAVGAALTAMGNVSGLRYTDDLDGVSANMFTFCVAGSSTGKESVQQAVAAIHKAAGIHGATHGAIKSEQEVHRNLIRNQAALYIIDEIGIFLQKINNARSNGGASYLDGVIGALMSAYSKADGYMLLTGDTKDEVRKALVAELSQCKKQVGENEDPSGSVKRRIPMLERALDNIDNGLEKPFLSLIGFTTPVTFDNMVNHEQATNGFIGRSLLINERETNPRARRGFRKRAMPDAMKYALSALYSGGDFDAQAQRVEFYGEKTKVSTNKDAAVMLGQVLDWIEDYAEEHKANTGLEAVVRRGYEIMAKISLILAAPGGVRTAEHVRWAFAIMKRDIDEKTRLAFANEEEKNNPGQALKARILNMLDQDHGETLGVICNRLRPNKKDVVIKTLKDMENDGLIKNAESKHGGTGKTIKKWYSR